MNKSLYFIPETRTKTTNVTQLAAEFSKYKQNINFLREVYLNETELKIYFS